MEENDKSKDNRMNDLIRAKAGRGVIKEKRELLDGFDLGAHIRASLENNTVIDGSTKEKDMNRLLRQARGLMETERENKDEQ